MTRDQFQKIEKILALDGYKNVVLFVHELYKEIDYIRDKSFHVIEDLIKENEILYKRIKELRMKND